jgi:7-cyano-7-deazaguanine synthase
MKGSKALVMLSGGLDSATCLFWAKKKFEDVSAITFNYYQRIENERKAAIGLAKKVNVTKLLEIDIPFIRESSEFPNRRHLQSNRDSRELSYIPARNLIFYSIGAHYAEFLGIKWIIGGHNSHDGQFFRDATKDYIQKINFLFRQGRILCNDESCVIVLPLAEMDRKKIVNLAIQLDVPLELTWSCHNEGDRHCGQCYSCEQRLEAFNSLSMKDPVFHI